MYALQKFFLSSPNLVVFNSLNLWKISEDFCIYVFVLFDLLFLINSDKIPTLPAFFCATTYVHAN